MTTFNRNSKRQDLELFFAHCGEYQNYVKFLFLVLSKTQGEIITANELLERAMSGDFISLKIQAYDLGYGV